MRKIAVSLPAELVSRAQLAVRDRRAASVSSYVARALEEKVKLDELSEMLRDMLAETGGPLTAQEMRAADSALGITPDAPGDGTRAARKKRRR